MCIYIDRERQRETERQRERETERQRDRETERETDSCAYLLLSMGICYSSKYPFLNLLVFATVANTH